VLLISAILPQMSDQHAVDMYKINKIDVGGCNSGESIAIDCDESNRVRNRSSSG
jgi:hypothetical protein